MSFLEWGDEYITGIESVDNEHKGAVEIINQLYELSGTNERSHISELLGKFYDETKAHFENEERLMKEYKIFNYFSHKAQHDRLLRILREFISEFDNNHKELTPQFLNLLHDWMINHFKFHDGKMGRELVEKGAK